MPKIRSADITMRSRCSGKARKLMAAVRMAAPSRKDNSYTHLEQLVQGKVVRPEPRADMAVTQPY